MELAYDVYSPPGDREQNLPPVICLHGMLDSRKTWKHIAPKIAMQTGRKVYAVDARNHGESQWEDYMTFDTLAQDLDNFLVKHDIPKAALVGHSMGGRTALTLALLKPEKVEKIVIEDIDLRNFRPSATSSVMQFQLLLKESLNSIPAGASEMEAKRSIVDFILPLLGNNSSSRDIGEKFDFSMIPLKCHNGVYSWQANLNAIEQFLTTDRIRQILSGVYMGDALFLYGTKSFFKVKTDPLIPKFFPRSVRLGFQGANHLIHTEHPKRFTNEVVNFIKGYHNIQSKY
ncbi:hypothetical protein JTE90_023721 [Oedothorax gibbosus]|uniref:sn-1-specific diacylglycerol lipase ABHD11 n=1 Tax=Oedothorax gibbosus TaxID=931172 RepID=A0AAV6V9Y6_9ARAC|nr:hypothetical protein JTE90_023721 [Oedothorax gibbosus]